MNFQPIKSYLTFTRSQRNGVSVLLTIIIALQSVYIFRDFKTVENDSPEEQRWLSLQTETDLQKKQQSEPQKIYPFNPNFITDFKGYRLGMSVDEIDRLLAFRKENKYVNSASEFQAVTKVSDSLLSIISPYFKFPDWVKNKNKRTFQKHQFERPKIIARTDINLATKEELMKVYGIGEALSDRILKMKEQIGGFVSIEQMNDVWGLSEETVQNVKRHFEVLSQPAVKKIAINDASLKELAAFPYFRYALAKEIVTYRSMNGTITGAEDLAKIKSFPVEKIDVIALYLEF